MSKEKNTTCFCSSTFSVNGEQLHAVCSLLGQCTYKNGNTKWCSIETVILGITVYIGYKGMLFLEGKWKPRISGPRYSVFLLFSQK